MKFILNKSTSSEGGKYGGMKDVVYGSVVEASYMNEKKKAILVSGSEMKRIGGSEKAFDDRYQYTWADFEEVD